MTLLLMIKNSFFVFVELCSASNLNMNIVTDLHYYCFWLFFTRYYSNYVFFRFFRVVFEFFEKNHFSVKV